jgi:SAM-dependent methyltransferase
MLENGACAASALAVAELKRPMAPPPIGACMIPIVEDYCALIKKGMSVLEIGCGSWGKVRAACEKAGAHYDGVDAQGDYYGEEVVATRVENLADLSFPDEAFDLVIATQSMEHWAEHGCDTQWGLRQAFRVCRTGGKVLLNVPIHFHGTAPFLLGDLDAIKELFAPFSAQASFEKWGDPPGPIAPYTVYDDYPALRGKHAYILDVRAVKDKPVPQDLSNLGLTGRAAQLVYYPFSYNWHRLLSKLGLRKLADPKAL